MRIASVAERRSCLIALPLLLASGCAVGPDYHAPAQSAPANWQATAAAPASALQSAVVSDDAQALNYWWTWFEDPSLTALMDMAIAQNIDVRTALTRVAAARA